MARREVNHFVETCDFCKSEFYVTSEEPSMVYPVFSYHYGGYGDQERIVSSKDACESCYSRVIENGYGDKRENAAYVRTIKQFATQT